MEQRQARFAAAYLQTMDPEAAARAVGACDGLKMLSQRGVAAAIEKQRAALRAQICPEDLTRRLLKLAFGRANDCVRLALEPDCELEQLDLSLLAEVKRSERGAVEVKLIDRLQAISQLDAMLGGQPDGAADFFRELAQSGADEPA